MATLADPMLTKRQLSTKRLAEMGLLRDQDGRRLVPVDRDEVARRLKERLKEDD